MRYWAAPVQGQGKLLADSSHLSLSPESSTASSVEISRSTGIPKNRKPVAPSAHTPVPHLSPATLKRTCSKVRASKVHEHGIQGMFSYCCKMRATANISGKRT